MANADDVVAVAPQQPKYTRRWTVPTNTWFAWMLTTLAGIASNAVDTGWSAIETKAIIGWVVAGAVAYLVPDKVKEQSI
jgi:hypothetical protein